jgi:hypothetical protein
MPGERGPPVQILNKDGVAQLEAVEALSFAELRNHVVDGTGVYA